MRWVPFVTAAAAILVACGARTGLTTDPAPFVCDGKEIPFADDQPVLYFVLDRSDSMKRDDKWGTVRRVTSDLVKTIGSRARFAAAAFPVGNAACGVGGEYMSARRGSDRVAAEMLSLLPSTAGGGTPTAATLELITQRLVLHPNTFAILATDGGPNCNLGVRCGVEQCILNIESYGECRPNQTPNCCEGGNEAQRNCLDGARTVEAVRKIKERGVPVFVVGIPGSALYGQILDDVAKAGGTARPQAPFYYRVDSSDAQALTRALTEIVLRITATCTLRLERPAANPDDVHVYLDGSEVVREDFTIDGKTVTLLGGACETAKTAERIRVSDGCLESP
jgi:hypothetical protein